MALIDDIKITLRISDVAYDGEINDLIASAQDDLILAGVSSIIVSDTTDPLIKRVITLYCKANFGFSNPDADRLQKSYDLLKMHLSLAADYNGSDAV